MEEISIKILLFFILITFCSCQDKKKESFIDFEYKHSKEDTTRLGTSTEIFIDNLKWKK